eukprot:Platyproteum_vivax@DN7402_c1_g2_i3.p1
MMRKNCIPLLVLLAAVMLFSSLLLLYVGGGTISAATGFIFDKKSKKHFLQLSFSMAEPATVNEVPAPSPFSGDFSVLFQQETEMGKGPPPLDENSTALIVPTEAENSTALIDPVPTETETATISLPTQALPVSFISSTTPPSPFAPINIEWLQEALRQSGLPQPYVDGIYYDFTHLKKLKFSLHEMSEAQDRNDFASLWQFDGKELIHLGGASEYWPTIKLLDAIRSLLKRPGHGILPCYFIVNSADEAINGDEQECKRSGIYDYAMKHHGVRRSDLVRKADDIPVFSVAKIRGCHSDILMPFLDMFKTVEINVVPKEE